MTRLAMLLFPLLVAQTFGFDCLFLQLIGDKGAGKVSNVDTSSSP